MSSLIVASSGRAARERAAWDLAATAVAVVGTTLLLLTGDPAWTSMLLLAVAATPLGGWRRWWPSVVIGGAALGLVVGLLRQVATADPDSPAWAAHAVAFAGSVALSLAVRRRLRHELSEVDRAVAFAQDAAVHDPLTGLANRRGLALLGGQILESARRRGDAVYCIVIDVDGLARVNKELGRSAGDDVLLTVAEGLRRSTRATDAVARWADDEFVVLGPGTGLAPLEMERRIRAHCVEHTSVDRRVWAARVSAGGAVLEPWDDGTLDSVRHLADREMHLRRALRREASTAAYHPSRLDPNPQPPHPRHPGAGLG